MGYGKGMVSDDEGPRAWQAVRPPLVKNVNYGDGMNSGKTMNSPGSRIPEVAKAGAPMGAPKHAMRSPRDMSNPHKVS